MIEDFSKTKVLVIGDVMLDRYWWGDVTRISPEAPVPIVRLRKDTYAPGGAANVAMNAVGLGAKTFLLGLVGDDAESNCLRDGLRAAGISPTHLIVSGERPTNVKTRVIAHSQQVVRVDRETTAPLTPSESQLIIDAASRLINEVDLVLISDYAKGTLSDVLLESVFSHARSAKRPVVVDPKGKDYRKYRGATILTPNRREAADACNLDFEASDLVQHAGRRLLDELGLDAILITESEHGMTLFERSKDPKHYDAAAKEVYDVTGAGDTVTATLGVALAAGAGLVDAARLANIAAGIVVQQVGTAAIRKADIAAITSLKSTA